MSSMDSNKMSTASPYKFDQFQNIASKVQQKMRDNEFCDVTLASADNHKFQAHKVILSAYSTVFKNMLVGEKHPHPMIFMRGAGHEVLKALLDFIYNGEANLRQEDIDSFTQLSADLELLGVTADPLRRENSKSQEKEREDGKACRYWNKGFCKNKNCHYVHNKLNCEDYIAGKNCKNKSCEKRHRKTCRDWYGTIVAVTEKTNVPTSIKKHTSQEEEVTKTARKVLTEVPLVKEVKEDTLIAAVKKTI